ncbi:STAS domain-containing protein [Streptomyces sp. NPDC002766]|uniref:STAS domain-containing protein n=1 Tax=Streptomyces sp. NPDC002766 TaxID=3154429 RepID=UPI003327A5B7
MAQPTNSPDRLSVGITAAGDIRLLCPAGEIDHDTGSLLHDALDTADTARPRTVVDFSRVTFMDSTGINILINAHRTHAQAGGWLRLAAPTGSVLRTMQIVGLDDIIDCRESLRQALGI